MQNFNYTPLYFYKGEITNTCGKRSYTDQYDSEYPSNTTILSNYESKYVLNKWIVNVGEDIANTIRNESAQAGTLAHSIVENYLEFGERQTNVYAEVAINDFYSNLDLTKLGIEEPVFYNANGLRVAGRYDQLVQIPDNTFKFKQGDNIVSSCFAISDLKTKRSYKDDGKLKALPTANAIQDTFKNCLQASMYAATISLQTNFKEIYGRGVEGAVLVYVNEKKSRLLHLNRADLNYYWKVYKLLLKDYHNIQSLSLSWSEMIQNAKVNNLPKEIVKIH